MATSTQTNKGAILLTGASGGIGTATVRRLDALGFQVFAGVRNTIDGERLQRDISSRVKPVLLDITDTASITAAAETITQQVGSAGLVGLINNAGIIVEGPVELVPLTEVRKQFEVNVIGQIAVTQAFLPLLRKARGRIINIGAPTGQVAVPYLGVLSASKAALAFITDALRVELRPWGMAVSLIDPMAMQTKIFEKSAAAAQQARQQFSSQQQQLYASALAAISKAQANQHMDDPAMVVAAIVHALTAHRPKTRYVVGRGGGMIGVLRLLPARTRDNLLLSMFGLNKVQVG